MYDLAPLPDDLELKDEPWLEKLAELDPRDYRIGIGLEKQDDEVLRLIQRGGDGRWWAGRYIGSITVDGRRLVIQPRLGIAVIEEWLDQAFGLVAPPVSARHGESETFIARLLARVWCRSVDHATRHGLPLLRLPKRHEGVYVRGRLDVRRTVDLFGRGREAVASVTYDRSLDHPATRAIVCAERALADQLIATGEWRTDRVRQVLPHLRAVVGSRPRLPPLHEVMRVRYTPMTLPFKQVAVLSHRIASRLGYSASDEPGQAEGILIDVAELWELFVLNCARQAVPPGVRVEHGATRGRSDFLLRSSTGSREMGRLKPDLLVLEGDHVRAVIDAKYKRLANTRDRPAGVDQADLYQLVAYAMRFEPAGFAALAYPAPQDDDRASVSTAEGLGPWRSDDQTFIFTGLPLTASECRERLRELLSTAGQGIELAA